ncbi:caspase family protein [Cucumibacter marinus]|uniref:caspase family protein n=1 Tax=Cucumibacter marinus TaxID=1121252 RepID=UPI000409757B|nr:caspase family protein [Cucumibacter marinus]
MTHRTIIWPTVLIAALLSVIVGIAPARAEARLALIIGNGNYSSMTALRNTRNDARLMRETLEKLGFEVVEAIDADRRGMSRAVQEFGSRLRGAGEAAMGLFYYAGHGVQSRGENYLIPLEAQIEVESDLEFEAITLASILRQMQDAGNATNILILDACRNNPLAGTTRSASRGLAPARAEGGAIIAFAAAPGQTAADGTGVNSPYAIALAEAMQEPGLVIEQVFRRVLVDVEEATGGQQIPWVQSSLRSDVYLLPEAPEPIINLADPPALPGQRVPEPRFEPFDKTLEGTALQVSSATALPEGGFILSGTEGPEKGNRKAWIGQLDPKGNLQWSRTFAADEGHSDGISAIKREEGGFYLLGSEEPSNDGETFIRSFWIWVVDGDGNPIIQWEMAATGDREAKAVIQPAAGGGFFFTALAASDLLDKSSAYMSVFRFDGAGRSIWAQGVDGGPTVRLADMAVSADRVFVTYSKSDEEVGNWTTWLASYDHDGQFLGNRQISPEGSSHGAESMAVAANGDLVIAGAQSDDPGNVDFWVARVSPQGELIASVTHDLLDLEWATKVAALPDGGAMVGGRIMARDGSTGDQDVWLAQFDRSGALVAELPMGDLGSDDDLGVLAYSPEYGMTMLGIREAGTDHPENMLAAGLPLEMFATLREGSSTNAYVRTCKDETAEQSERDDACYRAKAYFPELFEDDVAATD